MTQNALKPITSNTLAKAQDVMDNFEYLDGKITQYVAVIDDKADADTVSSQISTLGTTVNRTVSYMNSLKNKGNYYSPIYFDAYGVPTQCSGLGSQLRCTSRTSIGTTKPDMVIAQNLSGTSGYRIWASGFKECWGKSNSSSAVPNVKVTFSMGVYSFNSNPCVVTAWEDDSAYNSNSGGVAVNTAQAVTYGGVINGVSTTEFYISRVHDTTHWHAFGY